MNQISFTLLQNESLKFAFKISCRNYFDKIETFCSYFRHTRSLVMIEFKRRKKNSHPFHICLKFLSLLPTFGRTWMAKCCGETQFPRHKMKRILKQIFFFFSFPPGLSLRSTLKIKLIWRWLMSMTSSILRSIPKPSNIYLI